MKFWDSSAVVPLLAQEPSSKACEALLKDDPAMVVWWGTRVEGSTNVLLHRSQTL